MLEWLQDYNKSRMKTKRRSTASPPLGQKKVERKKIRYKCQKCNHIVCIKEGFNKQCTFCGGTNLVSQEWNSDLDKLIEESSDKVYER